MIRKKGRNGRKIVTNSKEAYIVSHSRALSPCPEMQRYQPSRRLPRLSCSSPHQKRRRFRHQFRPQSVQVFITFITSHSSNVVAQHKLYFVFPPFDTIYLYSLYFKARARYMWTLGQDREGNAWFRHRPSFRCSYLLWSNWGVCSGNLCKYVLYC